MHRVAEAVWTFDALGRVTQFTSADGTATYGYDATNQLTSETYVPASGAAVPPNQTQAYDANGNRTNTGYTTGANNQLANDGTFSYTYDDEGNRLTRTNDTTSESTAYQWDYRNRLTRVTEKDSVGAVTQVVEYTYDVFNRRIEKAVDTTSPFDLQDAALESYIYDDASGVSSDAGGNVILDFVDADGPAGPASSTLSTRRLYGNAVDQILAEENVAELITAPSRVLWNLVDNLGTVRDIARNDSTLATHFTYDAFGQVLTGDTSLTRYLYTSREYDAATGLTYYRARWYASSLGRFISEDPLSFAAGDTNIVRYVGNGPTNATDPSGLDQRSINGYQVKSIGGHHVVPFQLWEETGFGGEVFEIWDVADARVMQPECTNHTFRSHGTRKGYTGRVRELLRDELSAYIKKHGKRGGLTPEQQKDFARKFRRKILRMPKNTYIGGFNKAVATGGNQAVKDWYDRVGRKYRLPKPGSIVAVRGMVAGGGGKVLGALNVAGTISTIRDGCDAVRGQYSVYVTYYFEDEGGTYYYQRLGGIVSGTDKVYESGPREGEREPAFRFWAQLKVWYKRNFDRPTLSPIEQYLEQNRYY